jgi:hypothetical protein
VANGVLVLCLCALVGCSSDEPVAAPAVTVTATVTASPAATAESTSGPRLNTPTAKTTASANPGRSRRPSAEQAGSSAAFKHFKVSVRQVEPGSPGVRVLAEVCVRRLPPDPQGNRTRISWDPWSISTASKTVDASQGSTRLSGAFPADRTYRVGQCASGWIRFPTTTRPLRINYANGVGDVAIWDANHLNKEPRIGRSAKPREQSATTYYENCDAVRAAGKDPIRRGDPGYGAHLDADDDGVGCED